MWTEITNICRLRSQNCSECHKFESLGWHKASL